MIEVIPAILTDSSSKFKELIRKLESHTQRVHIDIADGIFVPNKTVIGCEELKEADSVLKFDIHLMVQKPHDYLKEWFRVHVDRFIIHAESDADFSDLVKVVRNYGGEIGLALNPETEVEKVENFIKDINFVQFMTVYPGFQGSTFVSEVVDKISAFHKKYPDIIIMCDGGITPETAPGLVKAGASILVSGSYIVKSGDVGMAIWQLKKVTSD